MNRLFYTLLLLASLQLANAQEIEAVKLHYQTRPMGFKSNYDRLITYDTHNNIVAKIVRTFDKRGNVLTESLEGKNHIETGTINGSVFTYDSRDNVLSIKSMGLYIQNYTYDSTNKPLSYEIKSCFLNDCMGDKYVYTYDTRGNKLSSERLDMKNNIYTMNVKYTYTYDSNNNKLSEIWRDDVRGGKHIYSYDAKNNLIQEVYFDWEKNAWVENDQIVYEYDSNKNKTSCITQYNKNSEKILSKSFQPIEWETRKKGKYTYDEHNNVLMEFEEELNDGKWNTTSYKYFTYDYNQKGNQVSRIEENKLIQHRNHFVYDENNRLIARVGEDYRDGKWILWDKEDYVFDINGNMVTHIIEKQYGKKTLDPNYESNSYDDGLSDMVQIKLTYTYNEGGMSTSGKCEILRNGKWCPQEFLNHSELYFYFSPQNRMYEPIYNCYRFEAHGVSFE